MTAPTDAPIPPAADTPADPANIAQPVEEPVSPPELPPPESGARHVVPPAPASPALVPPPVPVQPQPLDDQSGRDLYAVVVESRGVLVHGIQSLGDEFTTLARQSIDTTAHAAIQMLGVKTWADAIAVNTRYTRISCDHWLDGALKVMDLGVKVTFETSRPFLSKFGKVWSVAHPGH
jgi:hypothetical protein